MSEGKITVLTGTPWLRQPEESHKMWTAFVVYRDLGVDRTLKKVASKIGLKVGTLGNYSIRYKWKERARIFDNFLDEESRRPILERLQQMRSTHMQLAETGLELVALELNKHLQQSQIQVLPITKLRDLASVADSLAKLQRLTLGESTENINKHERIEVGGLETEELHKLRVILEKAKSSRVVIEQSQGARGLPPSNSKNKDE